MENVKSNPVGWFEIYVNKMDRARRFYESVFQVKLVDLPPPPGDDSNQMLAFPSNMEVYGSGGALVEMDGVEAGGNSTVIYFSSEDCSQEEKRIKDAGGKIFRPKMSIGEYGFIVLAFDTEGNMIGVHSQK